MAAAFAATVAASFSSFVLMTVALPLSMAAVVPFFRRKIFSMETFSKLLLGSIPDGEDCPFEIQGFSGKFRGLTCCFLYRDGGRLETRACGDDQ